MSSPAPFTGIDVLDPGESLAVDGFRFQGLDRRIIDRLLRVGAVTHRHDGHAALANPVTAPVLATSSGGGSVPAATPIFITYTLLDADGGESLPVDAVSITTAAGYNDPTDTPTGALDHAAGTLLAGNYSYAATVADGHGGETALGPALSINVPSGYANSEIHLAGLVALVNDASGSDPSASWRLWRSKDGGPWYLIGTGVADALMDDGIAGDCTVAPPDSGTTLGANSFQVTVPAAGQPAGAVDFNVYGSFDGTFTSPALLGTHPVADFDTPIAFTDLAVSEGAAPTVSTCWPGANPITAADLALTWLPPVATLADLPAVGNNDGDVRVVLADYTIHTWDAGAVQWQGVGGFFPGLLLSTEEDAFYAFALADISTVVRFNSATTVVGQIPDNATVPFPVGVRIFVYQQGAGQAHITASVGVTLESRGGLSHTNGQYARVELWQRDVNIWVLSGDMA